MAYFGEMKHFGRHIRLAAFGVLLAGCGGEPPPPETPASSEAHAPQSSQRRALVGRWRPTLERSQERAVALTRFALAEPPDDAGFENMQPSDQERERFRAVVKLRVSDPRSPMLADVRRKLAEYDALVIDITPTSIVTPATESDPPRTDDYSVVDESDGALTLDVGRMHDRVSVRFVDADHIVLRLRSGPFELTRDGASGVAMNVVSPPPGPRDACTEYADCVDEMPRLRGDEALMGGSSKLIRGWERTPDRLRQCASALQMARQAGLCK